MANSNKKSMLLNTAIIAASALLAAIIVYSNHFNKNVESKTIVQNTSPGSAAKTNHPARKILAENHRTYRKAEPFVSPLAETVNPPKNQEDPAPLNLGGDIANKRELQKALKRQTNDLQYELYSQNPHPGSKRALTLTKEEIKELEKSKRIIY